MLQADDVDVDPPTFRPVGPGDVFTQISLAHLSTPFLGPVIVVGHPCSLRRGVELIPDIPVAPIFAPGIPTRQHPFADRVFPVAKLLPPGSDTKMVVRLTSTTTVPATHLDVALRCASLNRTGVVALQQRVVGNQIRTRVPAGIIAAHCRGPLTEFELWTDWREACVNAGRDHASLDVSFDAFMDSPSGFGDLTWREAIAEHEYAAARAVSALATAVDALLS
jgi:hypothetical protein